jgi:preprotein translocase subunit Sss1
MASAVQQATEEKINFSFDKFMSGLGVFAAGMILNGVVGMVLWNWFVPDLFASAPKLNVWEALGLYLTVVAFTRHAMDRTPHRHNNRDSLLVKLGLSGFLLILGFIVHVLLS